MVDWRLGRLGQTAPIAKLSRPSENSACVTKSAPGLLHGTFAMKSVPDLSKVLRLPRNLCLTSRMRGTSRNLYFTLPKCYARDVVDLRWTSRHCCKSVRLCSHPASRPANFRASEPKPAEDPFFWDRSFPSSRTRAYLFSCVLILVLLSSVRELAFNQCPYHRSSLNFL